MVKATKGTLRSLSPVTRNIPWVFLLLLLPGVCLGEGLSPSIPVDVNPIAPAMTYPESYGGWTSLHHRFIIWIFIQQHFYLGSFILGAPMIAWLLETFAFLRRKQEEDGFASDMMQMARPFYSITVLTGLVLLGGFLILYPRFFQYLSRLFQPVVFFYILCFFLETLLFYGYADTWDRFRGRRKAVHLGIGFLACVNGAAIIGLANAFMSFMMSPQGVDAQGRFQGDFWAIVHTPFWNPLNLHRILASMMFSGCMIAAFAAFSMQAAKDSARRAYFDQMGYLAIMIAMGNLCVLPFAGYWFAKEIFIFRQRMGMTLMGGALSWLFVIQAMLVGFIFLTFIYYLWQGISRMEGSGRYYYMVKYLLIVLLVSFLVWTTPHTLPATQGEFQAMGGTQHPIVGYYGTMSAKNTAINTMILSLGLCFIILKRCNRIITVSWRRLGNAALIVLFGSAAGYILFLGVYGIPLPANIRVTFAFPQFLAAIGTLVAGHLINLSMLRGAQTIGPIQWGKLPQAGRMALFALAFLITTTMALMGYIRSSVRLNWHIVEIMEDVTPWAATPSLLSGVGTVLLNVLLFFGISFVILRASARQAFRRQRSDLPARFEAAAVSAQDP